MFSTGVLLGIFQTYGFSVAQTALIVALLWKIATNHLRHIADDIKGIQVSVNGVAKEVGELKEDTANFRERLAKVEGKLE